MELIFLLFAVTTTAYADYQPYIDGKYAYPKDDSLAVFPFDRSHVCKIRMVAAQNAYYAMVENVYNIIDRTPLFGITTGDGESRQNFLACFKYKQYSYVVYANDNTSLTTIMRGHLSLSLNFPFKLDFLCYDHVLSSLYAIAENQLFKVNPDALELLWANHFTSQYDGNRRQLERLFTHTGIHWLNNDEDGGNYTASYSPNNNIISDSMIVNRTLFYYEQNRLYLYRTEIRLHPENNFFPTTIVPIKSRVPKISFLLFENQIMTSSSSSREGGFESNGNGNNSPLIDINIPLPSETLGKILLPKNSTANNAEQNVQIEIIMWRVFLYCLDLIVILLILYFLRRQILRDKSRRRNGDKELSPMTKRRRSSSSPSYHSTTSAMLQRPVIITPATTKITTAPLNISSSKSTQLEC